MTIEQAPKRALTPIEKLPILYALDKAVEAEMKAVRKECDAALLHAYEFDHTPTKELRVGNVAVGSLSVTHNRADFDIVDRAAFEDFALAYGMATERKRIRPDMEQSIIRYLENNLDPDVYAEALETEVVLDPDWKKGLYNVGDIVTYMDAQGPTVPGVEFRHKTVSGTRIKDCKPADVLPLMQQLNVGVTAYLTGGAA